MTAPHLWGEGFPSGTSTTGEGDPYRTVSPTKPKYTQLRETLLEEGLGRVPDGGVYVKLLNDWTQCSDELRYTAKIETESKGHIDKTCCLCGCV